MKKFLLSLTMVSMVVTIEAPLTVQSAPVEVTSAGKEFVELLAKEDFAGAVGQFDETMKTALPEPKPVRSRSSLGLGRPSWPDMTWCW
jgi:hypothetical protein